MKNLTKILLTGMLGAATAIFPMKKAEAQVHGSVEYVHHENGKDHYGRVLGFYQLPEDIRGFSFLELYQNDNGYFGKTYLDKSFVGRIGPRLELNHIDNPLSRAGFGVSTTLPGLPKGAYARIGILPVWVGSEGNNVIGDRTMLQYAFGFPLQKGFNISGFGDWNLTTDKGIEWSYGEIEATKSFGPVKIGYNPVLSNREDGDPVPEIEHRAIVGVNF